VMDELTYMLSFKYLDEEKVLSAIKNRPKKSKCCGHRKRGWRCY